MLRRTQARYPECIYACATAEACAGGAIEPDARFPCTGDDDAAVDVCSVVDKAELEKYDALMEGAYGKKYAGNDEVARLM